MQPQTTYLKTASKGAPALIVFLIDGSASMATRHDGTTRSARALTVMQATITELTRRSLREGTLIPFYRIAALLYHQDIVDLFDGVQDLQAMSAHDLSLPQGNGRSDAVMGLSAVKDLLLQQLPQLEKGPPPFICHITDGEFTTANPAPVIRQLQQIAVPDGPALVAHVYCGERFAKDHDIVWKHWEGATRTGPLGNDYVRFLQLISSRFPETYRQYINSYSYQIQEGAAMLFPADIPELAAYAMVIPAFGQAYT